MARKQIKEERGMNSRGFIERVMAIQRTTDPRTSDADQFHSTECSVVEFESGFFIQLVVDFLEKWKDARVCTGFSGAGWSGTGQDPRVVVSHVS